MRPRSAEVRDFTYLQRGYQFFALLLPCFSHWSAGVRHCSCCSKTISLVLRYQ